MTKYFEFNWRLTVDEVLMKGATFDRWMEVNVEILLPFF